MVFNSINFLIFFSVVFFLFYFLNGKYRKWLLFLSSCIFYMWFIPVYILVLFLTILIDYNAALKIENSASEKIKKRHLLIGIVNTCLVLFIFKYCNFFIDNFNYLGLPPIPNWNIILPIGLSFHVFQSLSYVIEVYRGNIKAERDILVYSNFVMMFPQLVAGPIERASNLLPQLRKCDHQITYKDFSVGFTRFWWGLFKKAVVADTAGIFVDATYNYYDIHPGSMLLTGTILFAIQIYCDFSGYSDMAIGVARMLGFRFRENFSLPYFSKSVTEFWRRWHISLSSWLKDYLYISFGGNKNGKLNTYKNLMLTMLLGGLWHGASWNFIIWGGLNGLYLSIEKALNVSIKVPLNFFNKAIRCLFTFGLICFTWVFFRATSFHQAAVIIRKIFADFHADKFQILDINVFLSILISIILLLLIEFFMLRKIDFDGVFSKKYGDISLTLFSIFLMVYILLFGISNSSQFIYFQF